MTGSKRRPALVISELDGDDIILCQITGRSRTDKYAVKLEDVDYISGRLSAPSIARPNKIFTASKNLILNVACKIKSEKTTQVTKTIVDLYNEPRKLDKKARPD